MEIAEITRDAVQSRADSVHDAGAARSVDFSLFVLYV